MGTVTLRFYAELNELVVRGARSPGSLTLERSFGVGQTVKDLIEAAGVPHTEVDLVLVSGEPVGLDHRVREGDRISVYPVFESLDISSVSRVRAAPLRQTRFVADVHLGRLARYLRLLGFDTAYQNDWDDAALLRTALSDRRILLTRDRGLLKRAALDHGYLVRATDPRAQLREVVARFDLAAGLRPLSRCALCNGRLSAVDKADISSLLPERTAAAVDEFRRCEDCGQLYWQGAHHRGLAELIALARATRESAE
jgi:uncharacterized protein with PIN domain/sulfur carrier protein ThiS